MHSKTLLNKLFYIVLLSCLSNIEAQLDYHTSIPKDTLSYGKPFDFTTEREKEFNKAQENFLSPKAREDNNKFADKMFTDERNFASAYYQELVDKLAKRMEVYHKNINLYNTNKPGRLGANAGNSIWVNQDYFENHATLHIPIRKRYETLLHELNHHKKYDFLNDLSNFYITKMEEFQDIAPSTYDDYSRLREIDAERAALSHLPPQELDLVSLSNRYKLYGLLCKKFPRITPFLLNTDIHNEKGYLTKHGYIHYAIEALKQQKAMPLSKLQQTANIELKKTAVNPEQYFHGTDPELEKLSKKELNNEQIDFDEYYQKLLNKNKEMQNNTSLSFADIHGHKTDMLLADHRKYQFDYEKSKRKINASWRTYFLSLLGKKPDVSEIKKTHVIAHLDKNLKEIAHINARLNSNEFIDEANKDESLHYVRAHKDIAQNNLLQALRAHNNNNYKTKAEINSEWINQKIKVAQLEHDNNEVQRLTKIKADYELQKNDNATLWKRQTKHIKKVFSDLKHGLGVKDRTHTLLEAIIKKGKTFLAACMTPTTLLGLSVIKLNKNISTAVSNLWSKKTNLRENSDFYL